MVMMKTAGSSLLLNKALKIAICEVQPENIEWLVSSLRNQGVPSRSILFNEEKGLLNCIQTQDPDLIVWNHNSPSITLEKIRSVLEPLNLPIPILVSTSSLLESDYIKWKNIGVDDVIIIGNATYSTKILLEQAELHKVRIDVQKARLAMEDTDRRCDILINAVTEPIAYLNEGLHVKANSAYMDLLNVTSFENELEGTSLLDFVDASSVSDIKEKIKKVGRGLQNSEEFEVKLVSGNNISMVFSSAIYDGESCLQISVKKQILNVIEGVGYAAPGTPPPGYEDWLIKDIPTGFFNRNYFAEKINRAEEFETAWLVEINQHEKVLSNLGASQLDALMISFGNSIQNIVGDSVLISRWTASSLGILAPNGVLNKQHMEDLQKKIALLVIEVANKELNLTMSSGGVVLDPTLESDVVANYLESSLKKVSSVNSGVFLIDPLEEKKELLAKNASKLEEISKAIKENRFIIKYQPITSILGSSFSAYETRSYIKGQDGALLSRKDFQSLAKEMGILSELDWFMVHSILNAATMNQKNEKYCINITEALLTTPDLNNKMSQAFIEHNVAPEKIIFECESSLTLNMVKEIKILISEFQLMGSLLLISNFNEEDIQTKKLEQFKPNWISLSPLLTNSLDSQESQDLVKSIIEAGHSSTAKVVIKNVSSPTALSLLFGLNVDAAQGDFISPPSESPNYDFSLFS